MKQMCHDPQHWPYESFEMGYVSKVELDDGRNIWEVRDFEGDVIMASDNRSSCYFFAAEKDINICLLH